MLGIWLVLACASSEPAPPGSPAAQAVATIDAAGAEARELAALAARAEALAEELRVGPRPRELVQAELTRTLDELEARGAALDRQMEGVREALIPPK